MLRHQMTVHVASGPEFGDLPLLMNESIGCLNFLRYEARRIWYIFKINAKRNNIKAQPGLSVLFLSP